MNLRPVIILENETIQSEHTKIKIETGKKIYSGFKGHFHCWSNDYLKIGENAVGQAVAIIELSNGTIQLIPAENIQFIDK